MILADAINDELYSLNLEKELNLKMMDFENSLNVYQDKRGNLFFNLNNTIKVNVPNELKKTYTVTIDTHWPILSYNIYRTTRLTWLLMLINDVKPENVFNAILAGEKIKYIDTVYIREIINNLLTGFS